MSRGSASVANRFLSRLVEPGFVAILCCVALVRIGVVVARMCSASPQRQDFTIYYLSALALHDGYNPYTASFAQIAAQSGLNSNVAGAVEHATDPPAFLLLIKPLALMSRSGAFWAWAAVNAACLIGALILLTAGVSLRARLLLVALAIIYPPVGIHFIWGQSKILILLLLAVAMRSMDAGLDWLAGLSLAAAGLLRIFPLLLLLYLVLQCRWRPLQWAIVSVAGGGAATVMVLGLSTCLSFAAGLRLIGDPSWLLYHGNFSVKAIVFQMAWFIGSVRPGGPIGVGWRALILAAEVAVLASAVIPTSMLAPRDDPEWRAFGLWVMVALLLSPVAWVYDLVLALIPLAALATGKRPLSIVLLWLGTLAYLAAAVALWPVAMALTYAASYRSVSEYLKKSGPGRGVRDVAAYESFQAVR
jgi:hypothetical protein